MNNKINLRNISVLLLIISISLNSCLQNFQDLSDTFENDLNLELSTDLLENVASLQFVNNQNRTIPTGLSVEMVQSDYSEVFTFAGKRDLSPNNGFLLLGVRKGEFSAGPTEKIIELKATAPGFYPSTVFIQTDTASQDLIVEMIQVKAPGESLQVMTSIPQNNQPFSIGLVNGTKVEFDENTRYFDDQGASVSGNIAADVQFYPPSLATKRAFEAMLIDSSFINESGAKNPIAIDPVAMLDVKLTQAGRVVSDLSYPAEITLPIDQNLFNPIKDRTIQEGDFIPGLFWDDNLEAWQPDGFAIVERVNGQLVASLSVRHFTLWVVGWVNASIMDENSSEECQVFIRVLSDMPVPNRQRPEYRFFQIFTNCQSGSGFGLGSLRGEAKLAAQAYFKNADPIVFANTRFTDETDVEIISLPDVCAVESQSSFLLNIDADNSGTGTLVFTYGNVFGSRQINLVAGLNEINLLIPPRSLNSWLYKNANFRFTYQNGDCMTQRSSRQIPLCELADGVSLGVNNPVPGDPTMVDFAISTSCEGETDNLIIRPSFPVFYKESCLTDVSFQRLIYIEDGIFAGNLPLSIGKMYDFKIQYGTSSVTFKEITVPATMASYTVEDQTLLLEVIDGVLNFKVEDYKLPESICDFISG